MAEILSASMMLAEDSKGEEVVQVQVVVQHRGNTLRTKKSFSIVDDSPFFKATEISDAVSESITDALITVIEMQNNRSHEKSTEEGSDGQDG